MSPLVDLYELRSPNKNRRESGPESQGGCGSKTRWPMINGPESSPAPIKSTASFPHFARFSEEVRTIPLGHGHEATLPLGGSEVKTFRTTKCRGSDYRGSDPSQTVWIQLAVNPRSYRAKSPAK